MGTTLTLVSLASFEANTTPRGQGGIDFQVSRYKGAEELISPISGSRQYFASRAQLVRGREDSICGLGGGG